MAELYTRPTCALNWNQLYTQVLYNRIKSLYETKFELGVRILNPEYITFDKNGRSIQYDPTAHKIMLIELNLKTDDAIFEYWLEDLHIMMQSSAVHFYEEINKKFEFERNMYANGLTPIDVDIHSSIHWLILMNMCYRSAFQRYEYCWTFLKEKQKLEDFIRNLSREMINSIKNFNNSLNNVIKKISYRREVLIGSTKEQSWSDDNRVGFVELQVWFDNIVEVTCDTCRLIEKMQLCDSTCGKVEFERIKDALKRLLNLTLVLENQPPEIVKKDTNFPSKIRILLTESNINGFTITIHDNITPHSENEKRAGEMKMTRKFKFEKNKYDVYFESDKFQVERIDRLRSEESVTTNRYVLKYCLKLQIFNLELTASINSWPILVIVHQTQEAMVGAVNMWDKHFPGVDRVPWSKMCVALKSLFKTITDCNLNDSHLDALHEKASRDRIIDGGNFLWKPSCESKYKNEVLSKPFSFWHWFFEIMKIVRYNIKALWEKDLVLGFVSKSALDKLLKCPIGTFLLRFSDSVLGAITVIGVEYIPENGNNNISRAVIASEFYAPKNRSKGDSKHIILADIIRGLKEFTHLCDGTPKDQAFQEFYEKSDTKKDEKFSGYKVISMIFGIKATNSNATGDTNGQTLKRVAENTPIASYSQTPSALNGCRSDVPTMQNSLTPSAYSKTQVQSPLSVSNFVKKSYNDGLCSVSDDSLCGNGEDSIMTDLSTSTGMGSSTECINRTPVPTFSISFKKNCDFNKSFNPFAISDEENHYWQTSNGNDQNQYEELPEQLERLLPLRSLLLFER